jgi:microcin C transport system substrate-binding protein
MASSLFRRNKFFGERLMNRRSLLTSAALALVARRLPLPAWTTSAAAQTAGPVWRHGASPFGDLKYPAGFPRFAYVNAKAPKGGSARQIALGTFDNFNPVVGMVKGALVQGADLLYDTLLAPALDEVSAGYGLLAEALSYPSDFSSVSFRLRPEAKWHDGTPVTPDDVIFSFTALKKSNPQAMANYHQVVKAEKTGDREITFTFDSPGHRTLPQIIGQLAVFPKAWWEGSDKDGKARDIGSTTLEPPLGSGPYRIKEFQPGRSIVYERVPDYWGSALNVNLGSYNFDELRLDYFRDATIAIEAFKSGAVDWRIENSAKNWATAYDFPAVSDKRVILEEFPINNVALMQAFTFNLRRPKFQDPRLRLAFNYAFDFESMNKEISSANISAPRAFSKAPIWRRPACLRPRRSSCSSRFTTKFLRKYSRRPMPIRSAKIRARCGTICARRCGCSRRQATRSAIKRSPTSRPASLSPSSF